MTASLMAPDAVHIKARMALNIIWPRSQTWKEMPVRQRIDKLDVLMINLMYSTAILDSRMSGKYMYEQYPKLVTTRSFYNVTWNGEWNSRL